MEKLEISLRLSRAEKYPAKQHVRRAAAQMGVSEGLIFLLGQPALNYEDSDLVRPWRQRRYFYYASGVDHPGCSLTYDVGKDRLVLYVPEFDSRMLRWGLVPLTVEDAEERYDIDKAKLSSHRDKDIDYWQQTHKSPVYLLHPDHKPETPLVNAESTSLKPAMGYCRSIKDDYEIQRIRKANDISAAAHRAVLRSIRSFTNESEIHGLFVNVCISHGQAGQAYAPIAGSGENAAILHYVKNDEPLEGRQLVCLDAGAEHELYASDVTRTFPISGHFSKEAAEIYRIVETMQESSIQMLQPGRMMSELMQHCNRVATTELLKLGILCNGTVEEIIKAGTVRAFFPHGLGHNVGLDVHDVVDVILPGVANEFSASTPTSLRPSSEHSSTPMQGIEEGMVLTIEPGIYFFRDEIERSYLKHPVHSKYIDAKVLERYWAVGGVRIEDDVLITATGYENLTTAPKGQEALDLIRAGGDCSV